MVGSNAELDVLRNIPKSEVTALINAGKEVMQSALSKPRGRGQWRLPDVAEEMVNTVAV